MVIILFRVLIILALFFIFFAAVQYIRSPQRKIQKAKEMYSFYFLDEPEDNKKNLQFTYKGCLFEGEKYLGTTETAFEVVNIDVTVRRPIELRGITKTDLAFLEEEILSKYPYATVNWKHPINQLIEQEEATIQRIK
ncbi:MAG TPA: sigma-w pathway protein ysdB [Bacillota bacterium]|nr:sigma-w pathway protein ysdB [Bacillota bacterium]